MINGINFNKINTFSSLADLVSEINNPQCSNPEEEAAEYALDTADKEVDLRVPGANFDRGCIEAHLDVLEQSGACFDYSKALNYAMEAVHHHLMDTLFFVVYDIKKANEKEGSPIAEAPTNEIVKKIFDSYGLEDDEKFLENIFGEDLHFIRDAEAGIYQDLLLTRKLYCLSQSKFAKLLGVTKARVSDYERGARPVPRQVQAHLKTLAILGGRI